MSNKTVENVYTRQEAKELTRKHFWKLMGMMLIVGAIIYGVVMVGMLALVALTGTTVETTATASYTSTGVDHPAFFIGYFALIAVITLLGSGLGLGTTAAMLDLCRGDETVTVGRVFSRMGQCLKAFGLSLWIGLKAFLWMLPGYVVMIISILVMAGTISETASEETGMIAILLVMYGSMILIFALVLPAIFRYMLSTYILADKPETGVFDCVKQSKAMMKGHKWQAFKLVIPTFLIMYVMLIVFMVLIMSVTSLLAGADAIVAVILTILMTVGFLGLVLYYSIRMSLGYCLFYLKRTQEQSPAAEALEPSPAE